MARSEQPAFNAPLCFVAGECELVAVGRDRAAQVDVRVGGRDALNPHARRTNREGAAVFLVRVLARGRVAAVLTVSAGRLHHRAIVTPRL